MKCDYCSSEIRQKRSVIARKKILRCQSCLSEMRIINEEEFFECLDCKVSNIKKFDDSGKNVKYAEKIEEDVAEMGKGLNEGFIGGFDLVLVAPRHLFRMPYSLHEKTSLASIVLKKEDIEDFKPQDADPMKAKIIDFYPENEENEGASPQKGDMANNRFIKLNI